ncbi:TPA: lysozyme [Stenotrophomonas maltophilia]|jgi:lysozyme|uniref:lysozyme n=1 Tax=Stenotrophomonas TaxID=40323 RepID=UPI00244AFE04|nr:MULTISPECIES: lysozyme [Stenotrophomonas]MBN5024710.1 lysozyme [Stenotrophomonas maltophilia]MDH1483646.1 lysozyme [Stenotrophomonas sp. GD03712]WON69586.1 lysozyme [Stenotrophomonas maltophilia]HDS1101067.1 lysozyme [Stenotrophomonas maltophilia]HDS1107105.1 lysozyme [Stenotrophomonas maltophilia]
MKAKIIGSSAAAVIALAAAALVKPWEGYSPTPYVDMVGVATYCYGDTSRPEKAVYAEQDCAEKLNSRLGSYLTGISQCIKVPLREGEWAAVLSWTYNVGVGAACRSTLVGRINAGQSAASWCPELDRWVYAGGKRVQGLVNRRAAERRMCEGKS